MGKNKFKKRQMNKVNPASVYRQSGITDIVTTSPNSRLEMMTNLNPYITSAAGEGKRPVFRKFQIELSILRNSICCAKDKIFLVIAQKGASWTASDVAMTINDAGALDVCIDKPFGFRQILDVSTENMAFQPKNAADGVVFYQTKKKAVMNLLPLVQKMQLQAEDPIKAADFPEIWVVHRLSTGTTSTAVAFWNIDYSFDEAERQALTWI